MGSDLKLTGLASGFDWQPLVEKLIELESVPKRRLEAEKARNDEKVSELGILKSQLDTLNSAATALQEQRPIQRSLRRDLRNFIPRFFGHCSRKFLDRRF